MECRDGGVKRTKQLLGIRHSVHLDYYLDFLIFWIDYQRFETIFRVRILFRDIAAAVQSMHSVESPKW